MRTYSACAVCGHLWSDHYEQDEACGFVGAGMVCECTAYREVR